jgi:hypothetical protein
LAGRMTLILVHSDSNAIGPVTSVLVLSPLLSIAVNLTSSIHNL